MDMDDFLKALSEEGVNEDVGAASGAASYHHDQQINPAYSYGTNPYSNNNKDSGRAEENPYATEANPYATSASGSKSSNLGSNLGEGNVGDYGEAANLAYTTGGGVTGMPGVSNRTNSNLDSSSDESNRDEKKKKRSRGDKKKKKKRKRQDTNVDSTIGGWPGAIVYPSGMPPQAVAYPPGIVGAAAAANAAAAAAYAAGGYGGTTAYTTNYAYSAMAAYGLPVDPISGAPVVVGEGAYVNPPVHAAYINAVAAAGYNSTIVSTSGGCYNSTSEGAATMAPIAAAIVEGLPSNISECKAWKKTSEPASLVENLSRILPKDSTTGQPFPISMELKNILVEFDNLPHDVQIESLRDLIEKRRRSKLVYQLIHPIVVHATRTNAGVVGINNEETSFICPKSGKKRLIGRIKSFAKGNNSYGFVECPLIASRYGGDAFLRKDQYLDCFAVGQKVSFVLDLSKEGKPQAIDLMTIDCTITDEYLESLQRRTEELKRERENEYFEYLSESSKFATTELAGKKRHDNPNNIPLGPLLRGEKNSLGGGPFGGGVGDGESSVNGPNTVDNNYNMVPIRETSNASSFFSQESGTNSAVATNNSIFDVDTKAWIKSTPTVQQSVDHQGSSGTTTTSSTTTGGVSTSTTSKKLPSSGSGVSSCVSSSTTVAASMVTSSSNGELLNKTPADMISLLTTTEEKKFRASDRASTTTLGNSATLMDSPLLMESPPLMTPSLEGDVDGLSDGKDLIRRKSKLNFKIQRRKLAHYHPDDSRWSAGVYSSAVALAKKEGGSSKDTTVGSHSKEAIRNCERMDGEIPSGKYRSKGGVYRKDGKDVTKGGENGWGSWGRYERISFSMRGHDDASESSSSSSEERQQREERKRRKKLQSKSEKSPFDIGQRSPFDTELVVQPTKNSPLVPMDSNEPPSNAFANQQNNVRQTVAQTQDEINLKSLIAQGTSPNHLASSNQPTVSQGTLQYTQVATSSAINNQIPSSALHATSAVPASRTPPSGYNRPNSNMVISGRQNGPGIRIPHMQTASVTVASSGLPPPPTRLGSGLPPVLTHPSQQQQQYEMINQQPTTVHQVGQLRLSPAHSEKSTNGTPPNMTPTVGDGMQQVLGVSSVQAAGMQQVLVGGGQRTFHSGQQLYNPPVLPTNPNAMVVQPPQGPHVVVVQGQQHPINETVPAVSPPHGVHTRMNVAGSIPAPPPVHKHPSKGHDMSSRNVSVPVGYGPNASYVKTPHAHIAHMQRGHHSSSPHSQQHVSPPLSQHHISPALSQHHVSPTLYNSHPSRQHLSQPLHGQQHRAGTVHVMHAPQHPGRHQVPHSTHTPHHGPPTPHHGPPLHGQSYSRSPPFPHPGGVSPPLPQLPHGHAIPNDAPPPPPPGTYHHMVVHHPVSPPYGAPRR